MLLVDTSVWVDYFNDHPSREAEQLAVALAADDPMVMLGLVATELLAGLRNDAESGRIAGMPQSWVQAVVQRQRFQKDCTQHSAQAC